VAGELSLKEGFVKIEDVPFEVIDWDSVAASEHPGESGVASWRTVTAGAIRIRMVEYSPGYVADHWCRKGHVLLVLDGELETELASGKRVVLRPGASYQVADEVEPHRSRTTVGAKLFIVD
jgi:quercetin dioxygenase-like cupin family protein